jgi:regulator of sigma E protease
MASVANLASNIWWYLVLIGVMILIHELGHYWAARFFDVKVEAFSFGFGPRLFGFRKGETDFRFSAILFGGYVKMAGEQPGDETAVNDPRSFLNKPRWQRAIIAFAGPAINIVLAVALLAGLFMFQYPKIPTQKQPYVGYVLPEGAAAKAGIKEGDRVVQLDDNLNPDWEDILYKEVASAGQPMQVRVLRNGDYLTIPVTPVLDPRQGVGMAGWSERGEILLGSIKEGFAASRAGLQKGDRVIAINGQPIYSAARIHEMIRESGGKPLELRFSRNGQEQSVTVTPTKEAVDGPERYVIGVQLEPRIDLIKLAPMDAIRESFRQNSKNATLIFKFLRGIVERRMSPKSLEGPIRIAQISGEAAREGAGAFLGLMAMVSLNLAIFNLLPIPILDGGVILMLLIEMIMRRDLSLSVKEAVLKVGFVFLMAVVVFVIYNDIAKILPS